MSYIVRFTPLVERHVKKWKKSNPALHKKLIKIVQDIAAHPRTGIGHPEPLVKGNGVRYSRRVSAHDRIIYDIYDQVVTVLVIQVGGHYGDK
ncbi:MAG: Txe/YoeB family addiction module toxin [Bacteroidaceae bacterium]|nr:Txe/YoeB family addiction module toxin [Bacteroidaceae bacterium]